MKHCRICSIDKPHSEFNKNRLKADGLQSRCRECQKAQNNAGYKYNPKRKASIRATNKLHRDYNMTLTRRYKRYCGCHICDEREPVALDLHHTDPSVKDDNPSNLLSYSTVRLKREIRKCVVLCANCHRKVHAGILQI